MRTADGATLEVDPRGFSPQAPQARRLLSRAGNESELQAPGTSPLYERRLSPAERQLTRALNRAQRELELLRDENQHLLHRLSEERKTTMRLGQQHEVAMDQMLEELQRMRGLLQEALDEEEPPRHSVILGRSVLSPGIARPVVPREPKEPEAKTRDTIPPRPVRRESK